MSPDKSHAYETSHPWITFDVDLSHGLLPEFWMLLGEARSKCEHLANVPLAEEHARTLHEITLAKGVHATTAIEGNELTEEQVLRRIQGHMELPPSQEYQGQEVDNILAAHNWILGELRAGRKVELTPELICKINKMVLHGVPVRDYVVPGSIRNCDVEVGPRYIGAPWQDCEYLLKRLCDWLNGAGFSGTGAMHIPSAFIASTLAHLYLAWIHPFGDGNGRTARLVEFLTLVRSGVPTSAAHLISNHCNRVRTEYYRQLEYASGSNGDIAHFLQFCLRGFVDGLIEQLVWIYRHHFELTWRELVEQSVTGKDHEMCTRRRRVAEALLQKPEGATKREIKLLTPEVAAFYGAVGSRTLSRDLNALVKAELLVQKRGPRYLANTWKLLTLVPWPYWADVEGGAFESLFLSGGHFPQPQLEETRRSRQLTLPDIGL